MDSFTIKVFVIMPASQATLSRLPHVKQYTVSSPPAPQPPISNQIRFYKCAL